QPGCGRRRRPRRSQEGRLCGRPERERWDVKTRLRSGGSRWFFPVFVGACIVALTSGAPQASATTFSTPGTYTYTVPSGVTSVTVDAFGAQGGSGAPPTFGNSTGPGGKGGEATATLSVSAGDVLEIHVGG